MHSDEKSCFFVYHAEHFIEIKCKDLAAFVNDLEQGTLVTVRKRTRVCLEQPTCNDSKKTRNNSSYSEFSHLLPEVMTALKSMGRADDFGAVLKAIVSGNLLDNITLHLLLNVFKANYMSQHNVQSNQ